MFATCRVNFEFEGLGLYYWLGSCSQLSLNQAIKLMDTGHHSKRMMIDLATSQLLKVGQKVYKRVLIDIVSTALSKIIKKTNY